jgi:beta-glucosidase
VTIPLDFRAFAFYHPGFGQWITEDGEFDLLIGASSTDIRGAVTVTLQSTLDLPSLLTPMSTPRQWLADKRGIVVFAPFFKQILDTLAATFGVDAEAGSLNMDAMGYLLDMPLGDVLDFQSDALPAAPCEIVAGLLAQVRG